VVVEVLDILRSLIQISVIEISTKTYQSTTFAMALYKQCSNKNICICVKRNFCLDLKVVSG
jgi:hypothetical protein